LSAGGGVPVEFFEGMKSAQAKKSNKYHPRMIITTMIDARCFELPAQDIG
jgi:hypothetical protein